MKKKTSILIYPFVIIGVCFILAVSCEKEKEDAGGGNINFTTVQIPAGTFIMGSPTDEKDRQSDEIQHMVTLSAFLMSKYEITTAQYATFLNAKNIGSDGLYAAGAYPTEMLIHKHTNSYPSDIDYIGGQWVPVAGRDDYPVRCVTWYGAVEFATYMGGRLPTEAEWEYACRAGTTSPFSTGGCLSDAQANYDWRYPYSTCANTSTNKPGTTQKVGKYPPNAYGLHDMHGNVWEWCSDYYGDYPTTAQINPTGSTKVGYCVIRGGSYGGFLFDEVSNCRSANRAYDSRSQHTNYCLGFRIVLIP